MLKNSLREAVRDHLDNKKNGRKRQHKSDKEECKSCSSSAEEDSGSDNQWGFRRITRVKRDSDFTVFFLSKWMYNYHKFNFYMHSIILNTEL